MLVLGFDGGGSTARLAIADRNGGLVHYASAGGVNPLDNPAWRDGFEAVFAQAAPFLAEIDHAVAGLPSYGEVAEADRAMAGVVERFVGSRARLLNDVALAHYGAFAGEAGILVLSGTGSMAIAGGGGLPLIRVGGWGDELGDEGSAYWIGRRALIAAAWMIDGRAGRTGFLEALFDHLGIGSSQEPLELMSWYYRQPHRRSAAAGLARFVDRQASLGDETARSILSEAADHLALHLATAERRLDRADMSWTHAGGAFASLNLREGVSQRHASPPVAPRFTPLGGSLLMAARLAGWPADEAWCAATAAALAEKMNPNDTTNGAPDVERN